MTTVKDVIQDVIFEEKKQSLKLMYNIDVFIQEFKDKEEEPETPPTPQAGPEAPAAAETPAEEPTGEEETAAESFDDEGNLITEAVYKRKVEGELTVPKEEAENIQTLQDLIDYLSDKKHGQAKTSSVAKVLGKGDKNVKGETIISPTIQEVILILAGAGQGALDDIVDKGDKVIVEVKYGKDKYDNIGFKINKNAGTDVFSIMLVKDGELLPGQFNQALLNKQILYYRNSIA
jgi:hypothetical protein